MTIRRLTTVSDAQVEALGGLLIDCVEGGASVSFMLPFPRAKALAFWQGVADAVARGERALMVAEDATGIVGTVQLVLDQPENQPHRADLVKDTASEDADRLYARLGWQRCGVIPGYALLPQGGLCATTYFYRVLGH